MTRGDLTALVRDKSRSVQDLMVLTHVEPLNDVEFVTRELREGSETVVVDIEAPVDSAGSRFQRNSVAHTVYSTNRCHITFVHCAITAEDLRLHCYQAITTRREDSESTDPPLVVIEVPDIATLRRDSHLMTKGGSKLTWNSGTYSCKPLTSTRIRLKNSWLSVTMLLSR